MDDRIIDYSGLVNKPPIEEIYYMDLVNKPDILDDEALAHHGILKQRWGVRRYQNPDGSLTELGKRRYAKALSKKEKKVAKRIERAKKREQFKKELREKQKARYAKDPALLIKYQDMFTNNEIEDAKYRLELLNDIKTINIKKIEKGQELAQKILKYGDILNSSIDFINSNVGKAIRAQLGLGTNDVLKYNKDKNNNKKNNK